MIIIQIIGVCAMASCAVCFQAKKRGRILVFQILANLFWVVHFLLLKAYTGTLLCALSAIRCGVYYFLEGRQKYLVFSAVGVFCIISTVISILTYEGYLSLLALVGTLLQCVSFAVSKPNTIRVISLCASPFWFTYDILSLSYTGAVNEIISVISMIVGLIRYRKKGVENL